MAIRLLSSESINGALTLTGNLTGTSATLTGSLTGTSATFSGNVSIGDATTDVATLTVEGGLLGIVDIWRNGTNASYNALRFRDATNTNTNASIGYGTNQLRVNAVNNMVFTTGASVTTALTLDSSQNATFAGNVTVSGTSSTFNTGNSGTFVTNDTSNYPRLTMTSASAQLGLFRKDNGGMYIGGSAAGFRLYTAGFIQKLLVDQNGNATFSGGITATGITTTGSATFGSPLTIKSANPYIKWENAAGTRLAYIQHNETNLVIEADTGIIMLDANTQINGTLGVSSNVNTSGLLTATAIDTNAFLSNGSAADLHGRYLGQAIYGSGTGSGDNYGTVADVLRYKDIAIWRKNSSTNVWSNPSDGDALVNGNYAHSWGGYNMDSAYSEYVFYFSNTLGYSFISQTIIQHSTNGNSFNLYIERASSTTNPYDTTGWTTMVTQTGIASWPGITCNQSNWEVGGGYPGLFRIRLVPTWNNGNVINIGSFQGYGSYGSFSHAWSTNFDRSVNFQSKIGVGTNPSRALDVTQEALIQGAGNVNMGTLALGPRASGVGKWSTISGAHYNQSSGGGNGSGAAGIMMIGTYGGNGENDIYIGGGPYEMNAATRIGFYTHTTDTSTAGGSPRMNIIANGNVGIGVTSPAALLDVSQASGSTLIRLSNSDATLVDAGDIQARLLFAGRYYSGSGTQNVTSEIRQIKNNADGYGGGAEMAFLTNDTEKMRITSGGQIEIRNGSTVAGQLKPSGTDNDLAINGKRGQVIFEIADVQKYVMDSQQFYPTDDNARNLGTSSSRFSVVYSANGVNTSDETLKENIKECDLGIDFIDSLKPKSYNLKDLKEDNDAYGKKLYGLIAQDILETELKDSVFGKKDGEYGLSYNDLIAPMIKAIQELKAEIEILKSK